MGLRNGEDDAIVTGDRDGRAAVNREETLAEASDIPAQMDRLRAAIAALATKRRSSIESLLADGMTQAQIARHLHVTQRAIAKILHR